MNIDKGLIRHWACLCESEDGHMCEGVRAAEYDDDDPYSDRGPGTKTIDNQSNEESLLIRGTGHLLEFILASVRDTADRHPEAFDEKDVRIELFSDAHIPELNLFRALSGRDPTKCGEVEIRNMRRDMRSFLRELDHAVRDPQAEIAHELQKQLKNRIRSSKSGTVIIPKGEYAFRTEKKETILISIPNDIETALRSPVDRTKDEIENSKLNRDQYTKPNLPKESMSEADDEGKRQFKFRVKVVTGDGLEVVSQ